MPSFGLSDAADAIRRRVGPDARYTVFAPPPVHDDAEPPHQVRLGRLLWLMSLALLVIVLVLAVLVALGF